MCKGSLLRLLKGIAASVVFGLVAPASASTILEYDFRTAPSGTDVTASASVASTHATLVAGTPGAPTPPALPTTSTGANAGLSSFIPSVANGSITYVGGFNSTQSLVTSGANSNWVDFFGSGNGYGTGTAMLVYKPSLTGHGRAAFITHNANGVGQFWLHDNSGGPRLIMQGVDIAFSSYTWDVNTWYLIAASWSQGNTSYLYAQPLSPGGTLTSVSGGTSAVQSDADMSHPIVFNARSSGVGGAPSGESDENTTALYRLTTDYLNTDAKFTALYNSFTVEVPEPASMSMFAIAGITLIRRRM